ncbi:MAG: hypothetical protein Q4B50_07865 [Bacillota bacterium]|nr:hypothetical protein [Bacillota bacterium]
MLFNENFERYYPILNSLAENSREEVGPGGLQDLLSGMKGMADLYAGADSRELDSLMEEMEERHLLLENQIKNYLEREQTYPLDAKCKPLITALQQSLHMDRSTLSSMRAEYALNKENYSVFSTLEQQTRRENALGSDYHSLYIEAMQELDSKLEESSNAAFWNSGDFTKIRKAMKNVRPEQAGAENTEAQVENLQKLTEAISSYLDKKSLGSATERIHGPLSLAHSILHAAQDLMLNVAAAGGLAIDGIIHMGSSKKQEERLKNLDEAINEQKQLLHEKMESKLGELSQDDDFCQSFAKLEHLKTIKAGLLTPPYEKGHLPRNTFDLAFSKEGIEAGVNALKEKVSDHLKGNSVNLEQQIDSLKPALAQSARPKDKQQLQEEQHRVLVRTNQTNRTKSLG